MPVAVRKPMTEAEIAAAAAAAANAALDPQKAALAQAIAKAEAQEIARQKAAAGVVGAVGRLSENDAKLTQAGFQSAADRVASYGQGLTGAMRGSQEGSAAAVAERIRGLGGTGGVPTAAPANANVAYTQGALLDATDLATLGASSLAAGRDKRLAAGLALADNADAAAWASRGSIEETRQKIADIEAKRPGVLSEATAQIRRDQLAEQQASLAERQLESQIKNQEADNANAKRATETQIGYLQLQQAKTKLDQAIAMTNMTGQLYIVQGGKVIPTGKVAPGSDAVATTVRAETAAAARAATATQKEKDREARAEQARLDRIAAKERAEIAARSAANRNATTKRNAEIAGSKTKLEAETSFRTSAKKTAYELAGYNRDLGRPMNRPPRRVTLMNAIYNTHGAALVGKFGFTEQQVRQWAQQIVMAMPNSWWELPERSNPAKPTSSGNTA